VAHQKVPGLKGNPKSRRISKTQKAGKMPPINKMVEGPLDSGPRVRGNKAGKGRIFLPVGHVSRCS
jgi:hypothetical protein